MSLAELWFGVVAVFWTGFFVLEGFDFGVGVLHTMVGRDEDGRRVALDAIGPFWDGNEVWLIVAGAAIFAAFPAWYATMFSALYLGLLLVLVALIARGVSFEFRDKVRAPRWQRVWTWATILGSAVVPLVLGIGLGDLVAGLPVNADQEFTGSFADIFTAYGVWTGITLLALCALHGATFLALKTDGPVRRRARELGLRLALPAGVAVLVFAVWSFTLLSALAFVAVGAAGLLLRRGREGWAFVASAAAMASAVASLFVDLYPNVLVSSTNPAYSLTVAGAASGSYALKVMTVAAVVFFPLVLLYQSWSYRVFRARVTSARHDVA
jgi:cytochrome bd-type quinol oxidase subunit 2